MFLGIDVGTGGTRAVLINRAGKVLASHSADHAPIASAHVGWAEQDPEDWWRAAQEAILGALKAAALRAMAHKSEPSASPARCTAASCSTPTAASSAPRSSGATSAPSPSATGSTTPSATKKSSSSSPTPRSPTSPSPNSSGSASTSPKSSRRSRHVLCPKDYVRFRMTGDLRHRHAGGLRHTAARRRPPPLVAGSRRRRRHPDVLAPATLRRPRDLRPHLHVGAAATGLDAGTPVAAGAGDQGAGAVGMGILAPGSVSATIGTSGVVFAATAAPTLDPKGRLHTFCHAAPGIWHVMGVTNGAGL